MRKASSVGSSVAKAKEEGRGAKVRLSAKTSARPSRRRRENRAPLTAGGTRPKAASHIAVIGPILGIGLAQHAPRRAGKAGFMRIGRPCDGANKLAHLLACPAGGLLPKKRQVVLGSSWRG